MVGWAEVFPASGKGREKLRQQSPLWAGCSLWREAERRGGGGGALPWGPGLKAALTDTRRWGPWPSGSACGLEATPGRPPSLSTPQVLSPAPARAWRWEVRRGKCGSSCTQAGCTQLASHGGPFGAHSTGPSKPAAGSESPKAGLGTAAPSPDSGLPQASYTHLHTGALWVWALGDGWACGESVGRVV